MIRKRYNSESRRHIHYKANTSLELYFVLLPIFAVFTLHAQWVQTNGPYGGIVNCFTVKPNGTEGTIIFAGTSNGVFLSTNNGINWTQANTGLASTDVRALAVSGKNVFVGTSAPGLADGPDGGVYLSTNDGMNWTKVNNGLLHTNVSSIAVSPNGENLFAATSDPGPTSVGEGVFLSTNNGTSWTEVDSGLPKDAQNITMHITTLMIYPTGTGDTNIFAGTVGGVFLSTNNGTSWTAANSGLPKNMDDTTRYISVTAFTISPNRAGGTNLFAGTSEGGIFLSTDNGSIWNSANTGLPDAKVSTLATVPNGTSDMNIFAGTDSGVFLSTNSGINWTKVNNGLTNIDVQILAFYDTNLFVGTSGGGVFLSTDNGTHWTAASTGMFLDVYTVTSSHNGMDLFAGTHYSGVFHSSDNGTSWKQTVLTNTNVRALVISDSNLFAGTWDDDALRGPHKGGIFLSTNKGTSWTNIDTRKTVPSAVLAFALSGTNLFTGTYGDGVFLSTNNCSNWTQTPLNSAEVNALAISDSIIFAGTVYKGVFYSPDKGTNWKAVNTGLPAYSIVNALTLSSNGAGDKNLFAGTSEGIFRSTNNGLSWESVNTGIPAIIVVRDFAEFTNSDGVKNLFAGTDKGVFLSKNNGTTWIEVNNGLTVSNIRDIAVTSTNLFAGTYGGGVWKRPLSELITSAETFSNKLPLRFNLEQNYPNPFNPSTTIQYELPKQLFVTLNVFDVLGREVAVLVNEKQSGGTHSIVFNADNLPSGVYFFQMKTGNYTETKKMFLLR